MSTPPPLLQQSLFAQLPGCWGCKDTQSVFIYANSAYIKLIGLGSEDNCEGLTDFDMPSQTVECAQEFRDQDQYVMETQRTLKVLDIHPYPDGRWHAHIFTKTPWFNEDGQVQGTIFYGQELTDTAILEVGHWVCRATSKDASEGSLSGSKPRQSKLSKPLTTRESEVLFLLLYGKKPQYIANTLNISIKTVEGHVARLKTKFNATSKNQLTDFALDSGLGSVIPETLLKKQISVVLHSDASSSVA
ncbi:helix-turn-helix transcriptional regulator [Vibrio sp. 99-70-13A1]|uniref:helix-turn-helix transcriptional regulator n=1 Tax=Vibrio sp. 99-70-13A1 TaxID=2607601 RepID=UPI001493A40E|nr:helix-turn-helix transcriptional regulator [Vibrio sp. 99-70-13A1]NOH95903.1 helix-turn-helix transcriptional regulator [Vibrio sp. 99-70-13A1]